MPVSPNDWVEGFLCNVARKFQIMTLSRSRHLDECGRSYPLRKFDAAIRSRPHPHMNETSRMALLCAKCCYVLYLCPAQFACGQTGFTPFHFHAKLGNTTRSKGGPQLTPIDSVKCFGHTFRFTMGQEIFFAENILCP